MKLLYAQSNCQLAGPDGVPWNIAENSVWTADHPLVRLHSWAFSDRPTRVNGEQYHPVEQATAAPGERRGRVG